MMRLPGHWSPRLPPVKATPLPSPVSAGPGVGEFREAVRAQAERQQIPIYQFQHKEQRTIPRFRRPPDSQEYGGRFGKEKGALVLESDKSAIEVPIIYLKKALPAARGHAPNQGRVSSRPVSPGSSIGKLRHITTQFMQVSSVPERFLSGRSAARRVCLSDRNALPPLSMAIYV